MPEDFSLTSAFVGGNVHVVTVEGELDVATVPQLRTELIRVDGEGAQDVIVDLLAVPFLDSVAPTAGSRGSARAPGSSASAAGTRRSVRRASRPTASRFRERR